MFLLLVIEEEGVVGWLSSSSPCSWVHTFVLILHPVLIIGHMLPTPGKVIFATPSIITCVWANVFLIALPIICYITLSAHIFVFSHLITAETFSATMDDVVVVMIRFTLLPADTRLASEYNCQHPSSLSWSDLMKQ